MSDSVEIKGTVVHVGDLESISGGKYEKRELWIEVPGQYPQTVPVEFFGQKAPLAEGIVTGQSVTVSCNVKGRIWTPTDGRPARCFVSLDGWKLEADESAGASATPPSGADDDIPFGPLL